MTDLGAALHIEERRGNWVRLRTLIWLRWIAIVGQLAAIIVAERLFGISLETGLCYLAVGAAIIANLVAIFTSPENRRLSEAEVAMMLLFDVAQLSFLLFVTGGLNNPFALLILAPVTISATALPARLTILLGAVAIVLITVVGLWHLDLTTADGLPIGMPDLFVFGFWVAIVIGIVFEGIYARRVTTEIASMSEALAATQMALAREQKLTDLGGVVAAAAHELGTPLATIKLVSAEMAEELESSPDLAEDARLIRDQADRCRDILRSMGRAGKDDRLVRYAPILAVLQDAAEPHAQRGKTIRFAAEPLEGSTAEQPVVSRRPEILHGLRNLIQNAVDFADSTVWVDVGWSDQDIVVRIVDDGPGFPSNVLARIGDPFVRNRRGEPRDQRPEYEGMGLGLFIAKTLLERSGASLAFVNASDPSEIARRPAERSGAIVELRWPRTVLASTDEDRRALGQNAQIT